MQVDKNIISDEYIAILKDNRKNKSPKVLGVVRFYIFGNPQGKNIKPRMQIEIKNTDNTIIWDTVFDTIPPTLQDMNLVERNIVNLTYGLHNTSVDIKLWDNGCKKHVLRYNQQKFNLLDIFKDILSDSYQASKWIAKQALNRMWTNDTI